MRRSRSSLLVFSFAVSLLLFAAPQGIAQPSPDVTADNIGTEETSQQKASGNMALAFDGTDDFVSIPNDSEINTSHRSKRTIEAWFKVEDASVSSRKQIIWEEGGISDGLNMYIYDGALYVGVWSESNGWSGNWLETSSIESGRWHHVALVFDSNTGIFRGFLDGTEFGSVNPPANISDHINDIGIGAVRDESKFHDEGDVDSGGGVVHHFSGRIDEVRIWNARRTAEEIQNNIDTELNGSESGLVAYWPLNDGSGSTATDETGNGHDGTVNGASWVSSGALSGLFPPSNLSATPGDGEVQLTWSPSNSVDGYNVYRDTSSFSDVSNATKVNDPLLSDTSYTDTGVTNGTTYYYRVTAVDSAGTESNPSSEVSATPQSVNLDDGLVAYYPFDGNANDATGNGNDGTVNGATLTKDRFGNADRAYDFDGQDDYINLGAASSILSGNSFSLSLWTRVDSVLNEGNVQIISNESYYEDYGDMTINLNEYRFYTGNNSFSKLAFGGSVKNGEWHHIVVIHDGGNGSLFVDGKKIDDSSLNEFSPNSKDLHVGASDPDRYEPIDGPADDVRIYDRSLSETEIQKLYEKSNSSSLGPPTDLVASPGDQSISLNWRSESKSSTSGYNVYRDTASFSDVASATQVNTSLVPDTSYTDNGLTNGTTYYYRVTAVDGDGNESAPSSEVSATPSSGSGGDNTLDVGGVTIYADEITNTSGSVYEASGNVSVNRILNLEGTVTADTEALSIQGDGEIYLTGIPELSRVSLYDGSYTLILKDATSAVLNGKVLEAANSQLAAAGLDVHLNEIELLSDGVRVGGELEFPKVLGRAEPEISTLQITESDGLDFTGSIEVEDVGLKGGVAELDNLSLTYASSENRFTGTAMLVTTPLSLDAGTRVIGGQVDSVGVDIEVSPPVPIANTGFGLAGGGGSISGLVGSPTRLSVNADVTPLTGNTEVVTLADLTLAYRFDSKITGSGRVEIFEQGVGEASLTVSEKKVAFSGRVGLSVPDTESNVLEGQLGAGVSKTPTDNLKMNGELTASLLVPKLGSGFPYGWLSGGLGLPYEVAQTNNTLAAKPLDGAGRFTGETVIGVGEADFTEHRVAYGVAYSSGELSSSFADNMENLNEDLFSKSALTIKKAARRENRFEGQSLMVGSSRSNPLLSKRADSLRQAFTLQQASSSLIIRVQSDAAQPSYTVTTPSDRTLSSENTGEISTASYTEANGQNKSFYSIEDPATGEWTVNLPDDGTEYAIDVIGASPAPSLDLDAPEKSDGTVSITWQANDPDDEATVDLYYDTDQSGQDGVPIAENLSEDKTAYSWDISDLPTGTYYVYAMASDGKNAPTVEYAQEPVQVVTEGAPSAPGNVSATAQDSALVVSWRAVDGADRYTVYYEEGSDPTFDQSPRAGVGDTVQVALDRIAAGRTYHVAVTASDSSGNESPLSGVSTASYTSQTANNAPLISTTDPEGIAREGNTYAQQIEASDADGDPLSYSLPRAPDGMTIGADGQLSWDPVPGSYRVTARVTDGNGGADSLSYSLRAFDRESATAQVTFSRPTYVGYETLGQITVADPDLNQSATAIDSQDVRIQSRAAPEGIAVQLRETRANSGRFRASFDFGRQSSRGSVLNVAPSDTVQITYQDSYPDTSITAKARFYEEEPPKVAPKLRMPAASAARVSTHPTLAWTGLDAAEQYRVQVASNSSFETLAKERVMADTSLILHDLEKETTYFWRVRAENVKDGPWSDPVRFTTRREEVRMAIERSFEGAGDPTDYRLVALPGAVDRPLEQTLSGEAGSEWQAFWDDGSSENYLKRFDGSDTFHFRPGRGFWVTSRQDWTVDDSIRTVDLKKSGTYGIDLHDGWNIITNPLERDVLWQAVESANGDTLDALWHFDSGFERSDTLLSAVSGSAYYFLNDRGLDSLRIPYPGANSGKSADLQTDEAEQALALMAEQGPHQSRIYLRIQEDADEDIGPQDVVSPPARFSALSLRLKAPESTSRRRRLLVEEHRPPAQSGQTFRLLLQAGSDTPVLLEVENLKAVEREAIALLRPGTGRSYDLRDKEAITFQSVDSTALRLAIGTEEYVESKREAVLPNEVRLTSYPNPVREQGTIEYALPDEKEVSLRVYDVLGRKVATLAAGEKRAGRHTVRLRTEQLSSGVYFGRLQAGSQSRTLKITVVK